MNIMPLTQLEQQLEVLLDSLQLLRYENSSLKLKLKQHMKEYVDLENKNNQAITQLRTLISQLKEETR